MLPSVEVEVVSYKNSAIGIIMICVIKLHNVSK